MKTEKYNNIFGTTMFSLY